MNFAYLDPREILERVLQAPPEPLEPIPCELDERWKNFEEELNKYKHEFATARRDLSLAMAELNIKRDDLLHMRSVIDGMANPRLKETLEKVVDNYEVEEGIDALTQHCRELAGMTNAMERVMKDTNAERYASFTCFVCMDRLVELFIDPCGHVICAPCWARTPVRDVSGPKCPGCRSAVRDAKKIFTLS